MGVMRHEAVRKQQLVLLAEDDPDQAHLFNVVLKQVDPSKQLISAKDGDQLLKVLHENKPDVIFLDLNMPCKNGFECLEEIKKQPALKNIPVVVYSSSTHMDDIQKSYSCHADLYLVKPFNSDHLKNALQSILTMEWRSLDQRYYFINNRFVPFTS